MWPFSPLLPPTLPSWPSSNLLSSPCSLLLLPPSSSSHSSFSSLSTPAPDLVPSWLACLQQDSGCLPVAGRHRQRTRPGKGWERGPQRQAAARGRTSWGPLTAIHFSPLVSPSITVCQDREGGVRRGDLGSGWGGMGWSGGETSWHSWVLPAWGKSWRWERRRAHRLLRVSASTVSLPASFLLSVPFDYTFLSIGDHTFPLLRGREADQFLFFFF